jgi:excisionase family DNA binding protein
MSQIDVNHNNLPEAIAYLIARVEAIGAAVTKIQAGAIAENDTMTIDEVAELLRKGKSTIYQYTSAKTIPHSKIGNDLSFSRKEIKKWMDEHKVKLATETENEAEERMIALNKKKARVGARAH